VIVGVGVFVGGGVDDGVVVGLGVHEGVGDGVMVGVEEGVGVFEGVNEAGTKGVKESVLVGEVVGVGVKVGVIVTVPVTTDGVGLRVGEEGVSVCVMVEVAEGVRSEGSGARAMATQPMQ
jgi:hypothetical protein